MSESERCIAGTILSFDVIRYFPWPDHYLITPGLELMLLRLQRLDDLFHFGSLMTAKTTANFLTYTDLFFHAPGYFSHSCNHGNPSGCQFLQRRDQKVFSFPYLSATNMYSATYMRFSTFMQSFLLPSQRLSARFKPKKFWKLIFATPWDKTGWPGLVY